MRGPPPKPTKLKILAGNPGKRPLNDREPIPAVGRPPCPDVLTGPAREHWDYVTAELEAMGLLARADLGDIACLCEAWADFQKATRAVNREGMVIKPKSGRRYANPAHGQKVTAMNKIREFSAALGLDPSSRSRLQVAPKTSERSELDQFIGG